MVISETGMSTIIIQENSLYWNIQWCTGIGWGTLCRVLTIILYLYVLLLNDSNMMSLKHFIKGDNLMSTLSHSELRYERIQPDDRWY